MYWAEACMFACMISRACLLIQCSGIYSWSDIYMIYVCESVFVCEYVCVHMLDGSMRARVCVSVLDYTYEYLPMSILSFICPIYLSILLLLFIHLWLPTYLFIWPLSTFNSSMCLYLHAYWSVLSIFLCFHCYLPIYIYLPIYLSIPSYTGVCKIIAQRATVWNGLFFSVAG